MHFYHEIIFYTILGQAVLSVVEASSVYLNDRTKWGPEQALTEISPDGKNFWHSAWEDINPSITFKLHQEYEVHSVEIVDRQDCCHGWFTNVEVRVGKTPLFEEATTCGIQSFVDKTQYE